MGPPFCSLYNKNVPVYVCNIISGYLIFAIRNFIVHKIYLAFTFKVIYLYKCIMCSCIRSSIVFYGTAGCVQVRA